MSYFEILASSIPSYFLAGIPGLLAWLAGIVLAVIMLRRGGSKAEKLLLIGCSLMFLSQVIKPFIQVLMVWLPVVQPGMRSTQTIGLMSLPRATLDMAGIVCLLLAFWMRWKTQGMVTHRKPIPSDNGQTAF